MADSTETWIARQNIRRFERLLEKDGSPEQRRRLQALLADETRKLSGDWDGPAGRAEPSAGA